MKKLRYRKVKKLAQDHQNVKKTGTGAKFGLAPIAMIFTE